MAEEDQEKHLDPKLKAASVMKRKGMTALQRQAEHRRKNDFSGKGDGTGTGSCVGAAGSGCTGQMSQQVPQGSRCLVNGRGKSLT